MTNISIHVVICTGTVAQRSPKMLRRRQTRMVAGHVSFRSKPTAYHSCNGNVFPRLTYFNRQAPYTLAIGRGVDRPQTRVTRLCIGQPVRESLNPSSRPARRAFTCLTSLSSPLTPLMAFNCEAIRPKMRLTGLAFGLLIVITGCAARKNKQTRVAKATKSGVYSTRNGSPATASCICHGTRKSSCRRVG